MTRARRETPSQRARWIAAVALIAATALPRAAFADGAADADKHFRRGVDLYKDNDYAAALIEFQRAYEIQPSWQVLYNIGESQFQQQDYASALTTLERYLNDGGKRVPQKRRAEVQKDLEKLRTRVATLKVSTSEPGATIILDDVTIGTTPLPAPLVVSAGRRKLTATLGAHPPVTQVVQVASGDTLTVSLVIPPLPPQQVTVQNREGASLMTPLLAWAATAAVTTGAVVTGVLALGASGDLKDRLAAYPADPKAIASAHTKALALGITTDALTAVALATGGVSIWLTVKQQRAAGTPPAAPPPVSARVVVYPNGIGVAGSF